MSRPHPIAPFLAVALLVTGCSEHSPNAPSGTPDGHEKLVAWFEKKGVQVAVPATPKAVAEPCWYPPCPSMFESSKRILGDVDGSGAVDYWDVWLLWHYLTGIPVFPDLELSDIDRDGEVGWADLAHLGEAVYSTKNPHNVGFSLDKLSTEKSAFHIEVVYLEGAKLTLAQRATIQEAVDLWESIITEDIPDYDFGTDPFDSDHIFGWWQFEDARGAERVVVTDQVDDLRLLISTDDLYYWVIAQAGVLRTREDSKLPALSLMLYNEDSFDEDNEYIAETDLFVVTLHEIAHALGFGTLWEETGLLGDVSTYKYDGDTHFTGPLAQAAFDAAGGENYSGKKVPVEEENDAHWRESIMGDEVMGPVFNGFEYLSAITIQSLADLGYGVDVSQAEPYKLPRRARGKASAAPIGRCQVIHLGHRFSKGPK